MSNFIKPLFSLALINLALISCAEAEFAGQQPQSIRQQKNDGNAVAVQKAASTTQDIQTADENIGPAVSGSKPLPTDPAGLDPYVAVDDPGVEPNVTDPVVLPTGPTEPSVPTQAQPEETILTASFNVDAVPDSDPIKLILIVDDSSSMADKQDILSRSIRTGLEGLRGKNVEVFLYSTTQARNFVDSRQAALMISGGPGLFSNYTGNYATGGGKRLAGLYLNQYVANPGSSTNGSIAPFLARVTYFDKNGVADLADLSKPFEGDGVRELFTAGPSHFASGTIKLTAQMALADFNAALDKIATEIKIGDKGASDGELPLCTLATLLHNDGPYAPFGRGDKVGFMILTDEDQANLPCLRKYSAKQTKLATISHWPRMYQKFVQVPVEVRCDSAGAESWCPAVTDGSYAFTADCLGSDGSPQCTPGVRTCDAAELELGRKAAERYALNSQYRRLSPELEAAGCKVTAQIQTLNFAPIAGKGILVEPGTACDAPSFTMYDQNGQPTVVNQTMVEYFRAQYPKMDISTCYSAAQAYSQSEAKVESYDGVTDAASLRNLIKAKADALFGQLNYEISLIGNLGDKNPAGCSAVVSAKSASIIDLVGESRALSICESSYAPALKWFDQFARTKPRNEFELRDIKPGLKEIVVKRGGVEVATLGADKYTVSADGVLHLTPGTVLIGDQIEVRYVSVSAGEAP